MQLNNLIISGIMPFSCNDFPKEISYVIFLGGCNFRCPYCHNSSIVNKRTENIELNYLINELKKRQRLINAIVITGGEPTIYGEVLIDFIKIIKELGFKIKLDTNGTNPELVKKILNLNLIDYIAMDVKNIFEKYNITSGVKVDTNKIKKSIEIIESSNINYEFRTTVSKMFHNSEDLKTISKYFKNPKKYYIQNYHYNDEQLIKKDFKEFNKNELDEISKYIQFKTL